jgi:hypothetical protein
MVPTASATSRRAVFPLQRVGFFAAILLWVGIQPRGVFFNARLVLLSPTLNGLLISLQGAPFWFTPHNLGLPYWAAYLAC